MPPESAVSEDIGLAGRAARSFKWSALALLAPRVVTPVSGLILAALLTPADFGIVAACMIVLSFATIVLGLGLGPAVIQRRMLVAETANAAFWMNVATALVLYAAVGLGAPFVADAFAIPELTGILRIAGISLVLTGIKGIPAALLQREMQFRRLFWVEAAPPVVSALVAVAAAAAGLGVWALVWGYLAGTLGSTWLVWHFCEWRPSAGTSRAALGSVFGFSAWVMAANLQTWIFLSGDNAIAGYLLGTNALGIYSLGFNLSGLVPGLVMSSLSAVAYPAFCELQERREELGRSLVRLQSLAAAIIFPVGFGLAAVAARAIWLLYGDKWEGLGEAMQWMAIMPGLLHLWSLNADAFRAAGRPDIWPKLANAQLLILIPLLVVSASYGLQAFVLVRSGVPVLFALSLMVLAARLLGVSIRRQLQGLFHPLACSLVMFGAVRLALVVAGPLAGGLGWATLLLTVAAGAALYGCLLWQTNRTLWDDLVRYARQAVSPI